MSQSTLTVGKSSAKRKLMRAVADEMTSVEARQLKTLFAEMVFTTNLPHSWVEHAAVQKFFKALRPAFQLPTRHELSTPLLLGVYAVIATKVQKDGGRGGGADGDDSIRTLPCSVVRVLRAVLKQ
jgi:hypothetical protein